MKILIALMMCLIGFLISACTKPNLSPAIFNEICTISKPEIKSLKDAQNAYIDLYEAYNKNLKLLELLKEIK